MSTFDNVPFVQSEPARPSILARTEKATGLYRHAPITLVLGGWDSHGGGGPLVAKTPPSHYFEIIGLDAKPVEREQQNRPHGHPKRCRSCLQIWRAGRFVGDRQRQIGDGKKLDPSNAGLGNIHPALWSAERSSPKQYKPALSLGRRSGVCVLSWKINLTEMTVTMLDGSPLLRLAFWPPCPDGIRVLPPFRM